MSKNNKSKIMLSEQEMYEIMISPYYIQTMSAIGWAPKNEMQFLAYMGAVCIEYLHPVWFDPQQETSTAFNDLVCAFNEYWHTHNREKAVIKAADKQGISVDNILGGNPEHCLSTVNLGLAISSESQDVRFVGNALREYYSRCFSGKREGAKRDAINEIKAYIIERRNGPKKVKLAPRPAPLAMPSASSIQAIISANAPRNPGNEILSGLEQIMNPSNQDLTLPGNIGYMNIKLHMYSVLLLDQNTPKFVGQRIATMHGDITLNKEFSYRFIAYYTDIIPDVKKCRKLDHEFMPFLMQVYSAQMMELPVESLADEDKDTGKMLQSVYYNVLDSFIAEQNNSDEKYERDMTKAFVRISQLESELQDANQELEMTKNEIRQPADCPVDNEALEELRRQIHKSEDAAKASYKELACLKARLDKAEMEKKALSENIAQLNNAYNELNEQLLDSFEENGFFIDEEDTDEPIEQQRSGIRAKLGGAAIEKLSQKRIILVGGHENAITIMRELFPHWEYYGQTDDVKNRAWAGDAIACVTSYMSHSAYESARNHARAKNVRIVLVPYTSATSICKHLAKHLD